MKILEFQNMTNDVVLIRTEVFVEEQHFRDARDHNLYPNIVL